jgi:hypothetical protein
VSADAGPTTATVSGIDLLGIGQLSGNLIPDSNFDLANAAPGTDQWWELPSGGTINATGAEDGGPCLQITSSVSAEIAYPTDNNADRLSFPVQEGDRIHGEARCFVPTGLDTLFFVQLRWHDKDDAVLSFSTLLDFDTYGTSNAWDTVTTNETVAAGYVTAPANARYFQIQVRTGNTGAGGYACKVDNIRVWSTPGTLAAKDSVIGAGSGDIDTDAIGTAEFDGSATGAANQEIIMSTSGEIHSVDKDDFGDVTAGFWMGYSGAAYKFDFGDANEFVQWDGTSLSISNVSFRAGGGGFEQSIGIGSGSPLASETSYGRANVAIGANAGQDVTDGSDNVLVGANAGLNITTGAASVCVGSHTGEDVTTGGFNTLIGHEAGKNLVAASQYNIALGHAAAAGVTGNRTVTIGNGPSTSSAHNDELHIHNQAATDEPIIWGDMSGMALTLNADVTVSDDDASSNGYLDVEGGRITAGIDSGAGCRMLYFSSALVLQNWDGTSAYDNVLQGVQNGECILYDDGTAIAQTNATGLDPSTDDTYDLGRAARRWDDVYATNTTIQSSDARAKDIFGLIDPQTAWEMNRLIEWVSYKWSDYEVDEEWVEIEQPVMEWVKKSDEQIEIRDGKPVMVKTPRMVERAVYDELPVFDESGNAVMVEKIKDGEFEQVPVFDTVPLIEMQPHVTKKGENGEPLMIPVKIGEEQVQRKHKNGRPVMRDGKHITHMVQQTYSVQRMEKVRVKKRDAQLKTFNRIHFGLTAQQFASVCQQVGLDAGDLAPYIESEDGKLGFRYGEYIAILATALQEAQRRIEQLEMNA